MHNKGSRYHMGTRIIGIGSLSIPVLLAALFAGDNNVDSQRQLSPTIEHPAAVLKSIPLSNLYSDNEYALALRRINGFEGREVYIRDLLQTLNPQLLPARSSEEETALDIFNRRHDLSLLCMGIKNSPCEFVFINNDYFLTSRNQTPLRIAIPLEEVRNLRSKEEVINILEQKLSQHMEEMTAQHTIWAHPYMYDFPRNNTACMFALSLSGLSGMETDLVSAINMGQKYYGMSVEALCIDDIHKNTLTGLLDAQHSEGLPPIVSATRRETLHQLEISLQKAIDEGKSAFLFHYMNHGSSDGRIWASDGPIMPEEISEVISHSYRGKPLCAQIDITIWAGSCYSGKQLEGIRNYFQQRRDIEVRNLRIISESLYTTSGAGTTPYNASLVSDLIDLFRNSIK